MNEFSRKNEENKKLKLVNVFEFSAFNPVSSERAMAGDFFYIHVRVIHGVHFFLTANSKGFFINESTSSKFNPAPNADYPVFSNLLDFLLTVDKSFKSKFTEFKDSAQNFTANETPALIFQRETNKWLNLSNCGDSSKSEMKSLENDNLHGLDPSGMRDWNEELQNCRELPKTNHLMEINREKALITTKADFLDAAILGAKAIVDNKLWPLNPMDEKSQQVFVYNHIFFSFAVETPENFTQEIGQEASPSISTTNCDLNNLKILHKSEVEGLSLINEALIDVKGNRVIAQSIIPGILSSDYKNFTFYGSLDEGKTIQYSEDFHELVKKVCETFYLSDSIEFLDEEGKKFDIAGSIEVKGINGSDKRKYLIDLMRLSPRDMNYPDPELHSTCVLRHEMLNHYANSLLLENILKSEEIVNLQKEKDYEKYFKAINEEFAKAKTLGCSLKLNPNIGIVSSLKENETMEAQKQDLIKASSYLTTKMIPQLVREILEGDSYHQADSFTISDVFHTFGVNMRYLGQVYNAIPKGFPNIKLALEKCIILRAMKHVFREALRETDPMILSKVIAHLLNCAFNNNKGGKTVLKESTEPKVNGNVSNNTQSNPEKKKKKKKKNGGKKTQNKEESPETLNHNNLSSSNQSTSKLNSQNHSNKSNNPNQIPNGFSGKKTPIQVESIFSSKISISVPESKFLKWNTQKLWERIQHLAKCRYNHELPSVNECQTMNLPFMKISLLKNLCLVTGIVLQSADYDIFRVNKGEARRIFTCDDLVDVKPVVKHIISTSEDVTTRMEMVRKFW